MNQHPNWYDGCAFRAPKTNNPLERYNRTLKQNETHYQKKGLIQFKNDMLDIVNRRSLRYTAKKKPLVVQKEVTLEKQNSIQYAKLNKPFLLEKVPGGACIYIPVMGNDQREVTEDDIARYETPNYTSFDDFAKNGFKLHRIQFSNDTNRWLMNTECTCPCFAKFFMCKHIVSFATLMKLPGSPDKGDEIIKAVKRKPGRPKKVGTALQLQ